MLAGLDPAAGAVLVVARLLERVDALESNPEREATREADQAALATLAQRGLTPAVREHLRQLVETAQLPARTEPAAPQDETAEMGREEALVRLHAWFEEWSEVARVVVKRRDLLIRLGLARRRQASSGEEETPPVEAGSERAQKVKAEARKESQARKGPRARKQEPAVAEAKG